MKLGNDLDRLSQSTEKHLEFERDTVIIKGGRKLYRYTFRVGGDAAHSDPNSAEAPDQQEPETNQ